MSDWNDKIIEEFRQNGGKVGGHFEGATLLLLHTKGAKTGLERVNPVVYLPDGDDYVIIASKGGAPSNPDWYHNLLVNPDVTIEVGSQELGATATVAEEPERGWLYKKMVERWASFGEYPQKTSRVIPVIRLKTKLMGG